MNSRHASPTTFRQRAFTLIELIVVIAVLATLVTLFLPRLANPNRRSKRIHCVNNLKQIGLAFKISANDHNGRYPMQVWPPESMATAPSAHAAFLFRSLSNELSTPKILHCPTDNRGPATNFGSLTPPNVSYFIGLNARDDYPQSIQAGDRNLTTNGTPVGPGLLPVTTNTMLGWSGTMHKHGGNLALAGGSVQQVTDSGLRNYTRNQTGTTNWLAIP